MADESTADRGSTVQVRLVGAEAAPLWRDIRLRALRADPTAFASTYAREAALPDDEWRAWLSTAGVSVLGCAGGHPVAIGGGYVDREGWCHVVAMWVDPAWRGTGLGRRVLDRIVAWARDRELATDLDVTLGNDPARRLYIGAGFVATGETRPLRAGSTVRVERMVLP